MSEDDYEEDQELTEEDLAVMWDVNALLSALHEGSMELYESIMTESENVLGLLVMANATLKSMVDTLLEVIHEAEVGNFTFPDLIRLTAENLMAQHQDE